jgi:hypothetical protein
MMNKEQFETTILNLSKFHREHEKFYAQNPLEQANKLQFISRVLTTLADRWSQVEANHGEKGNPYIGCEDLNDTSTIAYVGVLFMEGEGEPQEITKMKDDIRVISEDYAKTGKWLSKAMEVSWDVAKPLIQNPFLADVLGERHRIIINDWQAAYLSYLVSESCSRAGDILDHIEFTPEKIREDLRGIRSFPGYLYSAKELLDHAADLASESATLVHDNERRWRVFRHKVAQIKRQQTADNSTADAGNIKSSSKKRN